MVKIKVGGLPLADDLRRVEAALAVIGHGERLAVDANCKFTREEALAYAKALAPLKLRWFEEPCDPLDFELFAEIASAYDAPLATGENLYSTQDVANLVHFGGLRADRDVIQVDPPQAYGIVQYARTVAMLERRGWRRRSLFPHGGNQMSLAIAGGFGLGGAESYPGVFGAFGGFADDARVADGYLSLSERPGIGFEGQSALYAIMRELAREKGRKTSQNMAPMPGPPAPKVKVIPVLAARRGCPSWTPPRVRITKISLKSESRRRRCDGANVMGQPGSPLLWLHDPRLAPVATSALPAWLWSIGGARILWANPPGAAIFGAQTAATLATRNFDAGQPAAAQIGELAATLVPGATPRLERLRGFGAGIGRALTCACSCITLADGTAAILVVAAERAGPDLALGERIKRLCAGVDLPVAAFAADGALIDATAPALMRLVGATTLAALGAEAVAVEALKTGFASGTSAAGPIEISRIGGETVPVLVARLVEPGAVAQHPLPIDIASARPLPETAPAARALPVEPAAPEPTTAAVRVPPLPAQRAAPAPLPAERRHPLRFVWQMDEDGRFTLDSDEFVALIGPRTGRDGPALARDRSHAWARSRGSRRRARSPPHDTWSGIARRLAGRRRSRAARRRAVGPAGVRPRAGLPRLSRLRRLPRSRAARALAHARRRDRRPNPPPRSPRTSPAVARGCRRRAGADVEPGRAACLPRTVAPAHAPPERGRRREGGR